MAPTLILSALLALVTSTVYAIVGKTVLQRPVAERNALANQWFATWWFALAMSTAVGPLLILAYYAGTRQVSFYFALTLLNVFLICLALLGLLYYLGFLYTGRRNLLLPMSVGYVLYFFFLVYFLLHQQPSGVQTDGWRVTLQYAMPASGLFYTVIILLLVFPQIVAGFALFGLSFRVEDPERKFRTIVVSWSIIIWFSSALIAALLQISQTPAWQVASRFIGLGAALAILTAYRPPGFIRRRLDAWSARRVRSPVVEETTTRPASWKRRHAVPEHN